MAADRGVVVGMRRGGHGMIDGINPSVINALCAGA